MANEDKRDDPSRDDRTSTGGGTSGASADRGTEPAAPPSKEHDAAGGGTAAAGEVPGGMGPLERAGREGDGDPATLETTAAGADGASARRDEERAAPPAAASRGGGGRGFLAGIIGSLLVLGLVAAAGFATRDRWAPPVAGMLAHYLPQAQAPAPAPDGDSGGAARSVDALQSETADIRSQLTTSTDRLSSLQQEVESLRQEIQQVAAAPGGDPQAAMQAPQADQPDLSQPLEDIDQRLSDLEVGSERLNAFEQQLEQIQSSLSQVRTAVTDTGEEATRPAATVLAVNQLAEALGRSGGYAQQLETLRVIAGDDAALTEPIGQLEQWAGSGLASFGSLRARFPELARRVAQSDYQLEGDSWIDSVTNRLTSLVAVRKIGDNALAGGGTDAALSEAETALQSGDLAGAVKALESLQGQAADVASAWLEDARNRLAAEKALADLRMAAIAQLDAARG